LPVRGGAFLHPGGGVVKAAHRDRRDAVRWEGCMRSKMLRAVVFLSFITLGAVLFAGVANTSPMNPSSADISPVSVGDPNYRSCNTDDDCAPGYICCMYQRCTKPNKCPGMGCGASVE
jgi:hypothetical protein